MMTGFEIVKHPVKRSLRTRVASKPGHSLFLGILFSALFFSGATVSSAQDLGAIARQERARKESQPKSSRHVYTKEDLARPQILTPEDRQRFEAARTNGNLPLDKKPPTTLAVESGPAQTSLGEIARKYRQQKLAQESQRFSRFPLPINVALLASPIPTVQPPSKPIDSTSVPRSSEAPRKLNELHEYPNPSQPTSTPSTVRPVHPLRTARPLQMAHRTTPRSMETVQPARGTIQPLVSETGAIEVRRGDSLWKLAEQYLGQGMRWRDLYRANPWILDPNHIEIGQQISLPHDAALSKPPTGIRVQKGDSLWKIAQRDFGEGAAWTCIARANPEIRDTNLIFAGQELKLSQACAPSP